MIFLPCAAALLLMTTRMEKNARRAAPSVVKIEKKKEGYTLLRNGSPYFVKGGGGSEHLDLLKRYGGNSVRTWGGEHQEKLLDKAESLGMTVTLGVWLGHERHGFRYNDPKQAEAQKEAVRKAVLQYRNHPALLMWALGNEMEGDGSNPLIWKAINDLAEMVHQLDPNHPTMTVIAEIGGDKAKKIAQFCPALDLVGINSYGGLGSLADRLREQGWTKPYVVTEFGPLGSWEGGYSPWKAPLEQTSHEKAQRYLTNYLLSIGGQPGWCLGSYAFLWGAKQEATHTWFNLLLPAGEGSPGSVETTEAVDALSFAWTGTFPKNRAPELLALKTEAENRELPGGKEVAAQVAGIDPDGDPLTAFWEIRAESTDRKSGGDAEAAPPSLPQYVPQKEGMKIRFLVPREKGEYRLFVFLRDGKGHAGTANVPFRSLGR